VAAVPAATPPGGLVRPQVPKRKLLMQPFDIEFEAPTETITNDVLEAAQALARRAADLVETAADAAAEPAPTVYVPQPDTDRALPAAEIVAASSEFGL
jgi:hypothetical protein